MVAGVRAAPPKLRMPHTFWARRRASPLIARTGADADLKRPPVAENRSPAVNNATFVGNLAADPKLITSKRGSERAIFSVALDEYNKDEDTPPTYVDVTVFSGKKDDFARNVAESLTKGKRVVVIGRATTYKVDAEIDGEDRQITKTSFIATSVAPDLRWQSAKVTKVTTDRDHEDISDCSDQNDDDRGGDDRKNGERDEPRPTSRGARSSSRSQSSRSSNRPHGSSQDDDDEF